DEERFAEGSIVDSSLEGPAAGADVRLAAIAPLSTRVARLSVDPAASSLALQFNRSQWVTDSRNLNIAVVVYREGLPGTALPTNASSLTFNDFEADAGSDFATFYVVVVNNSFSATNTVVITAESTVPLPVQ